MSCRKVQRSLAAYRDGLLAPGEERELASHLAECRTCGVLLERLASMRQALRALPPKTPPARLSTSLRVLASRELADRPFAFGAGAFVSHWLQRTRIWADDMMRPLALPLAGGLLSAVVLFAILVPSFAVPQISVIDDVPTALSTEASVRELGPFGLSDEDIILDITVNREGRVVDYSTPGIPAWANDSRVRRNVENMLLLTVFNPGTMFGQPSSGKVRILLRRSEIDVRG